MGKSIHPALPVLFGENHDVHLLGTYFAPGDLPDIRVDSNSFVDVVAGIRVAVYINRVIASFILRIGELYPVRSSGKENTIKNHRIVPVHPSSDVSWGIYGKPVVHDLLPLHSESFYWCILYWNTYSDDPE